MMPVYTVHAPAASGTDLRATDSFAFVRDGFHFGAALLGPIWLARHRLWLALLGWIVGEVIATDPVSLGYLTGKFGPEVAHKAEYAAAAVGAVLVLVVGGLWRRSRQKPESAV